MTPGPPRPSWTTGEAELRARSSGVPNAEAGPAQGRRYHTERCVDLLHGFHDATTRRQIRPAEKGDAASVTAGAVDLPPQYPLGGGHVDQRLCSFRRRGWDGASAGRRCCGSRHGRVRRNLRPVRRRVRRPRTAVAARGSPRHPPRRRRALRSRVWSSVETCAPPRWTSTSRRSSACHAVSGSVNCESDASGYDVTSI